MRHSNTLRVCPFHQPSFSRAARLTRHTASGGDSAELYGKSKAPLSEVDTQGDVCKGTAYVLLRSLPILDPNASQTVLGEFHKTSRLGEELQGH